MKFVDVTTPGVRSDEMQHWLKLHDIEADDTYKVEVDEENITVYQYHREGKALVVGEDGKTLEVEDPFTVPLKELLPSNVHAEDVSTV